MRIYASLAAVALLSGVVQEPAGPTVRFHHLHVRVDEPALAMADVVREHGGTRVILQGHGVGVRIADQYVIFDRRHAENPPSPPFKRELVSKAYEAVVRAFAVAGVDVTPAQLEATRVAHTIEQWPGFGFAAVDIDEVARRLVDKGGRVFNRTQDSWFIETPGAGVIEITKDTDRPDTMWCPMHPDVRSASPGKCPICGMDLVTIPPPRVGEYRLDLEPLSRVAGTKRRRLAFRIREPESDAVVEMFTNAHQQLLHLFVIGRDLRFFAHEHPERVGDRFELSLDLDPGAYMLIADFLPTAGSPQMVHQAIVVPGTGAMKPAAATLVEDRADKTVGDVRVRMETPSLLAGRRATIRFTVSDAASGAVVTNLQPYLGASGHLLIVSSDLTQAVHAHPDGAPTAGPAIAFEALMPAPGLYKLWVQFQRGGRVMKAPFVVAVGAV
jgi:hypothetical protein